MFDKDMLKSILAAYGPSGREQTVSDVIRSYVEPFADEVYNDTLGNLIAVKKGASARVERWRREPRRFLSTRGSV